MRIVSADAHGGSRTPGGVAPSLGAWLEPSFRRAGGRDRSSFAAAAPQRHLTVRWPRAAEGRDRDGGHEGNESFRAGGRTVLGAG